MNAETHRIDLSHVIDRMHEEYGKKIFCGEGWYQLIWDLDYQLALIDSDYTIFQIKEKFGELRFYYGSKDVRKYYMMSEIVEKYEAMSTSVCEETGLPGELMKSSKGNYKTLNRENAAKDYKPVHNLYHSLD
jgi:hypothetical protein